MPETDAAVSGSEPAPFVEHKSAGDGPISPREAARSIVDWRRKSAAENPEQQVEREETPLPEESVQADAGDESPPSETIEPDPAEQLPPIEPPRSWSKEDKELFSALPRETQERLSERERSRDSDFSRRQQQATEHAKALEAERSKVEQARQQYEAALPILLGNLQQAYNGEFSDITTVADVQKMAAEDPARYTRWDAQQKQLASVQYEIQAAQERQTQELQSQLKAFIARETARFAEKAPEFGDPEKRSKLMDGSVKVLKEMEFTDDELGKLWRGEANLSLHDHRFQLLVRDAYLYREAQASAEAAKKQITDKRKPIPPVHKPGAAPEKGAAQEQRMRDLTKTVENARGINQLRAAAKLLAARRTAR